MTERELFIERFKNKYNMKECNTPFGIKFSYGVTQDAFDVWIASASRQGYKLVPVETLGVALSWAEFSLDESWSCEQHVEINKHTDIINKAMTGVVE